jgi:predicted permease
VSHGLWERELGGRPDVVGQTVRVSGSPLTIVGVVGRGFRGLRVFESPDVWVPINTWPAIRPSSLANLDLSRSGWGWLTAFGRLRPGVSIERAEQVVKLASLRADEEGGVPERFRKARSLAPALAAAIGEAATSLPRLLGLLMGAVGLLLGLACANVATLLLARSYVRQRELAVRAALGGGRGRLLRQLLAEALLLGGLGGLAGFAIYHPGVALLRSAALPGGIRLQEVGLGADGRSIAAVAVLAVASALLVGLAPALRATSHGALTSSFGLAGRSAPRRSRLRAGLVALQVALAVVLLVGAGLFGRGLARALAIDTGFRADGLTVVSLNLGLTRYTEERARPFYQLVAERVKALPGVRDATWALAPPLASGQDINTFTVVGEPPNPDGNPVVEVNLVGPEFWDVMGSGVVSGRPLEPTDQATGEKVVVISEAMARKFWPDRDPLGVRLIFDDTLRVVGVARTIKYHALDESPVPIAYFAHAQANGRPLLSDISLVVQGRSVPPSSALIAEAIRSVDPNVAVQEVGDYPSLVARVLLPQRLAFGLLGGFALLALVVAAVGVYSVMSGLVATRMQEFGIRKALGATVPSLVALAIRDQGLPVAAGLVAGLLVATAAGRLATSLLYGVSAADPAALAIAGLGLAATAAAAAALPAWRGARSEPMATLRDE